MYTRNPGKPPGTSYNSAKEPLTVLKLKTFEGFANLSNEEAEEIVRSLQLLAVVLFEYERTTKRKGL